MRRESLDRAGRAAQGYTLVEMLVVMGIILLMVTLALLSISSMLRSSRMANVVNLFVGAADEARTAGITLRRSVQVDLTRLDADGKVNRLTTIGSYVLDNFEGNVLPLPPALPPPPTNWVSTPANNLVVFTDGSQCMKLAAGGSCYNSAFRLERFEEESEDYEALLQARIKIKPAVRSNVAVRAKLNGCVNGTQMYSLSVQSANTVSNIPDEVKLERSGSALGVANNLDRLPSGQVLKLNLIKDGLWYRVKLSVKRFDEVDAGGNKTPKARIAGKVWVDGQLEPAEWTAGPQDDLTPLQPGFAGFSAEGGDLIVDDVFFDLRAIRPLPKGLRVDMLFPEDDPAGRFKAGDLVKVTGISPFNFPVVFRPDGTSARRYVLRLTDMASGDKRYVVVEQNTGRTRPADDVTDALGK
jgi:prepilin-type N-terminal cleavage/methylation domain-containing protein